MAGGTHCPACGLPFAMVGRAHRCVPRQRINGAAAAKIAIEAAANEALSKRDMRAEMRELVTAGTVAVMDGAIVEVLIPSETNEVEPEATETALAEALGVGVLPAEADTEAAHTASEVFPAGNPAGAQAIGAYQPAPKGAPASKDALTMSETPPAGAREGVHGSANRGEPAPVYAGVDLASGPDKEVTVEAKLLPDGALKIISITEGRKPPKRDRAAYMRDYRKRQKVQAGGAA